MSKTQDAVDYIFRNPGTTQYAAAKKFNIGQSAISVTLAKNEIDIAVYRSLGDEILNKVDAAFISNPGLSSTATAKFFGLQPNTLRSAYRGREVLARRALLARGEEVNDDPVADMREKCAKIAEMVGGEHGAAIAASIRAVEV